jgi:hypothetical protein
MKYIGRRIKKNQVAIIDIIQVYTYQNQLILWQWIFQYTEGAMWIFRSVYDDVGVTPLRHFTCVPIV